ncbi:MAG: hypothetical protein HY819_02805 [Acidobacteria bacterium]|nr:hypothetical protein [Acidobacteriota bacterium]
MLCFRCQTENLVTGKVSRMDSCSKCHSDLHVCLNCSFYDAFAHKGCREPSAEIVRDKEKANFCEYFNPNQKTPVDALTTKSKPDDVRNAFNNLFKKS